MTLLGKGTGALEGGSLGRKKVCLLSRSCGSGHVQYWIPGPSTAIFLCSLDWRCVCSGRDAVHVLTMLILFLGSYSIDGQLSWWAVENPL